MPTPMTYLPYSFSFSTSEEKSESPDSRMNVPISGRSEEHTSELQSRLHLVCRLLLEKKKKSGSEATTTARSGANTPYSCGTSRCQRTHATGSDDPTRPTQRRAPCIITVRSQQYAYDL